MWNDKLHKRSHKDIDARWTKKNNGNFYGYKNHAKVDTKSKFINTFAVTGASVHDPQATDNLLEHSNEGQDLHADSAYTGENQQTVIAKHKMIDKVHEMQSIHERRKKKVT